MTDTHKVINAASVFWARRPGMRSPSCMDPRRGDPIMHERRTKRSGTPQEAAHLFLQSIAARHGLQALALASDEGLLIAGIALPSSAPLDLDWIGAIASVCAGSSPNRRGPSLGALVERATGGRHLEAAEIVLRGERLYLAAVGGAVPAGREVWAGIERILAESLPAVA
jgi:hypothetical protein